MAIDVLSHTDRWHLFIKVWHTRSLTDVIASHPMKVLNVPNQWLNVWTSSNSAQPPWGETKETQSWRWKKGKEIRRDAGLLEERRRLFTRWWHRLRPLSAGEHTNLVSPRRLVHGAVAGFLFFHFFSTSWVFLTLCEVSQGKLLHFLVKMLPDPHISTTVGAAV